MSAPVPAAAPETGPGSPAAPEPRPGSPAVRGRMAGRVLAALAAVLVLATGVGAGIVIRDLNNWRDVLAIRSAEVETLRRQVRDERESNERRAEQIARVQRETEEIAAIRTRLDRCQSSLQEFVDHSLDGDTAAAVAALETALLACTGIAR